VPLSLLSLQFHLTLLPEIKMASASPTIAKAKPRGGGPLLKASSGGNPATIRLKVVVRHLPSLMREDEFKNAMTEYINEETVEWAAWIQGKIPEEYAPLPPVFPHVPNSPFHNLDVRKRPKILDVSSGSRPLCKSLPLARGCVCMALLPIARGTLQILKWNTLHSRKLQRNRDVLMPVPAPLNPTLISWHS